MGFLQSLAKGIKSVENTIAVGAGAGKPPQKTDYAHTIQPGQKLSPAVQAQNAAPIQNEYNAQGQPTQEVLGDVGDVIFPDGGHVPQRATPNPLVYNPHFGASLLNNLSMVGTPKNQGFGIRPVQQSNIYQVPAAPTSYGLQGQESSGFIPMQGSIGAGTTPQMQAYNNPQQQPIQYNQGQAIRLGGRFQ